MARPPRTTDLFIRDVKQDLFLSATDQEPFSDADILAVGQRQLEAMLVTLVEQDPEAVASVLDFGALPHNDYGTPGLFQLPSDCMLQLLTVTWVDEKGEHTMLDQVSDQDEMYLTHARMNGVPRFAAMLGGSVRVFPFPRTPTAAQRIRIRYVARPLDWVLPADDGVSSLSQVGTSGLNDQPVYVPVPVSIESGLPQFADSDTITILSSSAPHTQVETIDAANWTLALSSIFIDPALQWPWWDGVGLPPWRARPGDFIAVNYTTELVQVPHSLYNSLVDATVARLSRARHDPELFQAAYAEHQAALRTTRLRPRLSGQRTTTSNRTSALARKARGR